MSHFVPQVRCCLVFGDSFVVDIYKICKKRIVMPQQGNENNEEKLFIKRNLKGEFKRMECNVTVTHVMSLRLAPVIAGALKQTMASCNHVDCTVYHP